MSDYLFKGSFAEHIGSHVCLKQAIGYKYEAEARHLLRFSTFTAEKYPDATMLPFDYSKFLDKFDANHCHAVYGDIVDELKMICTMLDIDIEVLA